MNKSKEEWRLKLSSLLQDGDISGKHPRIEKKIWDCVLDAIESEAVKRENFAFNKGRTTHSQNREAEIVEKIKNLEKQNHDAKCQWDKPRTMESNNYNCTDLHTGYAEAISDVLNALTPPPESPEELKD